MFGQPSAFGATPAPAFGAPAPAFGAPAPAASPFGAPAAPAFGAPAPAPTAFGFGAPAAPAFGAPAPVPTGFGAPAPAQTGFGFGAPAAPAAPAFGAPAQATSPFGAAAPQAGLFGAPAAPQTGLFGAAPAPTQASPFGAPAATPAMGFGAPAAPVNTMFGAPAPAPAFGAPAQQSGFGFGSPAPAPAASGTNAVPYAPTPKTDNNIQITIQSITAMPSYEQKSFEELRLEDYTQNNRGSRNAQVAAPAAGGFGFGAPAKPAGLFGAPAAPQTGLFGAAAPAPAFGAPAPAAGFGFGAPAAAPAAGMFGAPAAAPGLFGAPAAAPAFGAPAAPAAGLFGAPAAAPAGLFGAPAPAAPAAGFGFGAPAAPAPAAGGFGFGAAPAAPAFGAPAAGGLFGSPAPAPLFGATAPAPAATGLFGAPAPAATTNLFGAPAPAPAAGGGLFGSTPAPAAGGLFGTAPAAAPAGGLFGAPAVAPTTGFGFGAPAAPAATGLFGAPAPATNSFGAPAPATGLFGASAPAPAGYAPTPQPSADMLLAQKLAAVEKQRKELALLDVWKAGSSSHPKLLGDSTSIPLSLSDRHTQPSRLYQALATPPRSNARIRPRGYSNLTPPPPSSSNLLLGNGVGGKSLTPGAYLGSSTKRLVIHPDSLKKIGVTSGFTLPTPPRRLLLHQDVSGGNLGGNPGLLSPQQESKDDGNLASPDFYSPQAVKSPGDARIATPEEEKVEELPKDEVRQGPQYDFYKSVVGEAEEPEAAPTNPHVPTLTKTDYIISPTLTQLSTMSEASLATVPNFTISRPQIGSVEWEGAVDIRSLNLDLLITIQPKEVAVYADLPPEITKPPVGTQLNRPAIITLLNIYPKEDTEKSKMKMEKKIQKQTVKMDAELVSYDAKTGVWKFRTKHFSKYGLLDDDDDDSDEESLGDMSSKLLLPGNVQVVHASNATFRPNTFGGGLRAKVSAMRLVAPDDDDTTTTTINSRKDDGSIQSLEQEYMYNHMSSSNVNQVNENSSVDTEDTETKILAAADMAYQSIVISTEKQQSQPPSGEGLYSEDDLNKEITESYFEDDYVLPKPTAPPISQFHFQSGGICARMAQKAGISNAQSSKLGSDFRMRTGRSFRACFHPLTGKIIHPRASADTNKEVTGTFLGMVRPVWKKQTDNNDDETASNSSIMITHLRHVIAKKEVSFDEIPPIHILPRGLGAANGTLESYKSLCIALDDMGLQQQNQSLATQTFALLSCLYGQEEEFKNVLEVDNSAATPILHKERRFEGLLIWLRSITLNDVQQDITKALNNKDGYTAILAAYTGGNLELATKIAMDYQYPRLAVLLSCGDKQQDMGEQMKRWQNKPQQIPLSLERLYRLMGGDFSLEENLYQKQKQGVQRGGIKELCLDWKRRLLLQFFCTMNVPLHTTVLEYDHKVAAGLAPPPTPKYATNTVKSDDCVLFKILRHFSSKDGDRASLATLIQPTGLVRPPHNDVRLSFSLAALLHAIGCCGSLSAVEECRLLEGYAGQLVSVGLWEYAVYITLCCLQKTSKLDVNRVRRAKEFVFRYLDSKSNVQFLLQQVGIPSIWLKEALAQRFGYTGDVVRHVSYLLESNLLEEAACATEELVMTSPLFRMGMAGNELYKFLGALKREGVDAAIRWNEGSGCGAVLDFMELGRGVMALIQALNNSKKEEAMEEGNDLVEQMESLWHLSNDLQTRFADIESVTQTSNGGSRTAYYSCQQHNQTMEKEYCFADVLELLSFFRLVLSVVRSGLDVDTDLLKEQEGNSWRSVQMALFLRNDQIEVPLCETKESIGLEVSTYLRAIVGHC